MSIATTRTFAILLAIAGAACATSQSPAATDHAGMNHEAHLKQMQSEAQLAQQGEAAMGFDQMATTHHFYLDLKGGVIQVTVKDPADEVNRKAIRSHLQQIAAQFAAGDFEKPLMTHGEPPDGVAEMVKRAAAIAYTVETLPDGGRVRITSTDGEALAAVHEFLRYQIREHKTGDPLTIRR